MSMPFERARDAMRARTLRAVAAGAAGVAAVLYFLIGVGVISVGEAANGGAPDLFAFGAMVGGAFAVTALLLWFLESRVLWAAVAVLQVIVIAGYVIASDVRNPPFEIWGILVKVAQVVVLAAVAWLLVLGSRREPAAFGG